MSKEIGEPQQYKQASRKGKRAWRKHVDITEVQEGLRQVQEEIIEGGVVAEKPSEDLFTIDTVGSDKIRTELKKAKPLKADEVLAKRSAIPAVDSRKRPNSKVTDGIIEPKIKRHRSDWVTREEWLRLKRVAKEANPGVKTEQTAISYDPWSENVAPSNVEDSEFSFLPKPKPVAPPPTLTHAPLSLAANGKPVPAVRKPDAGISYNPTFEDWDKLLTEEGQKAVEAEKQRLEEERLEQERLARIAAAKPEDDMVQSDDESAWEGFESEYEASEAVTKKRPERKTQAQRNKIKRRKEAERRAKWEAKMKKREQQAAELKAILKAVQEKEEKRRQGEEKGEPSSDEGDDLVLRRRRFGKFHAPEKPLEVVLPDELQESLRMLKPEGNLLGDRFRNLVVQGKLEARKPVWQSKKAKREYTEKWTYKDFKI